MSDPFADPAVSKEEEADPQFEPVFKLTDQIETKTHEEDEEALFKMRAKLFRFESTTSEWKERGTGDVRLLAHKETKRVRLVMRRDKTLKVCANHFITSDMRLQPNIGSDRSWVWKAIADFSEGNTPVSETLAIRFANADNAGQFKAAFEDAQRQNALIASASATSQSAAAATEETPTPAAPVTEAAEPTTSETAEPIKAVTEETPAASETTTTQQVDETASSPQEGDATQTVDAKKED